MARISKGENTFELIFLLGNRIQSVGNAFTGGITVKQWLLLQIVSNLESAAPSITELSVAFGCSRQNVSEILIPLERKGFVTVRSSTVDHRARIVALTKKGEKHLQAHTKIGEAMFALMFEDIPLAELETFFRVCDKALVNVNKIPEKIEKALEHRPQRYRGGAAT